MTKSENHLDQVIELLREGTDLKLLYHSSSEAEEALKDAHKMASKHDIPKPWPQLASYRLAHILMRRAKSKKDFVKIDELLAFAVRANCLGPLPRLYRIAAMFRSGVGIDQMKPVFNNLLSQIDHFAENVDFSDRHDHLTAIQNNFFNMAELAAYFTGYPYEGFEGKGGLDKKINKDSSNLNLKDLGMRRGPLQYREPYSDLFCKKEDWRLVGTVPGLSSTAYPGEMALEELEDRMVRGDIKPPCVSFRMSADKTMHEWNFNLVKYNDEYVWNKVTPRSKHLLFLTSIFYYSDSRNRGDLLVRIFNSDTIKEENKFRKWKERCDNDIVDGIRYNFIDKGEFSYFSEAFLDDTATGRPVPLLNPEISVLGAFDTSVDFA